jgi:hypothetical protein
MSSADDDDENNVADESTDLDTEDDEVSDQIHFIY